MFSRRCCLSSVCFILFLIFDFFFFFLDFVFPTSQLHSKHQAPIVDILFIIASSIPNTSKIMDQTTVFCENKSFLRSSSQTFSLDTQIAEVASFFQSQLISKNLESAGFFSFNSGKPINKDVLSDPLSKYTTEGLHLRIRWNVKCCGGKGGFGSMLRAQGGKMSKKKGNKKAHNNDSFRTLEGRRVKNVRQAKELAAYIDQKQITLSANQEEKKQKLLKIISTSTAKTQMHDVTHAETLKTLNESIKSSTAFNFDNPADNQGSDNSRGLSASPSSDISATENKEEESRVKGINYFDDFSDSSDESESDSS